MIKTELRNLLLTETVDDFLMIARNGPSLENFEFENAFNNWKNDKKRYFLS